MFKRIIFINEGIIIFEIVLTAIIRRVYVNNIDFTRMGIGQFRNRGEIIALNYKVVRCIGIVGDYRMDFIIVALDKYGQVLPKLFLDVFGLFFPYKTVFLMAAYEFEQRGLLLVCQSLQSLYFASKFCLVHGTSGCFKAA